MTILATDRPLVTDASGRVMPGDVLGALTAMARDAGAGGEQIHAGAAHQVFHLGRETGGDGGRQDLEQSGDGMLRQLPPAEHAGDGTKEDAKREQRYDERIGNRAGHRKSGMLVKPVYGFQKWAMPGHAVAIPLNAPGRSCGAR